MKQRTIKNMLFQVVALPEGDSAIVELLDDSENDIGHITLDSMNNLHLVIFGTEHGIQLSELQIKAAFEFARRNLFNVDNVPSDKSR